MPAFAIHCVRPRLQIAIVQSASRLVFVNRAGRGLDLDVTHPDLPAPPLFILAIPSNGIAKPPIPIDLGLPSEPGIDLVPIAGMSEHLPWPIPDVGNPPRIAIHCAQHITSDLQNSLVLTARDIEDLP